MTKQEILEAAKLLPKSEQIDLAMDLWDQIEFLPEDLPPTEAQKRELDRRLAEYEANPDDGESWEVVRARLLREFKKDSSPRAEHAQKKQKFIRRFRG